MIVPMPGGEHGLDLLEAIDLHLDMRRVGEPGDRALERGRDRHALLSQHREVVVLGHDRVRQREPVVVTAAVDDGVPLERPETRRRLAGVGDAGAGVRDLGDIARGERGDARHPLREVEPDALGRQHRTSRTGHDREHGALLEPLAVLDDDLDVDRRDRSGGRRPRTRPLR